jgi:predicted DsbA family dithiol-disulfide isomerase
MQPAHPLMIGIGAAAPPKLRVIEVFADVTCPFTHVGLRRVVKQRERLGRDDVVLRVRAWPLELVNGAPLSGPFVSEEIAALREAVAPDLFRGFDPARFPTTTIPALALAASAYGRGHRIGEAVSLALRTAVFEEGRDIANLDELTRIARSVGLPSIDRSAEGSVHDDWHDGERRGVVGSPHFFVDGEGFFCPTLDIERVDGRLQIDFNREGYATFIATVFDEG